MRVCGRACKCVEHTYVALNFSHRPSHHHHQNPRILPYDAVGRFCCSNLADFAIGGWNARDFCLVSSKASSQNSSPVVASVPDFRMRSKVLWYLTCSGLKQKLIRSVAREGGWCVCSVIFFELLSLHLFSLTRHARKTLGREHVKCQCVCLREDW